MCQHCLHLVKYKHVTGVLHGFTPPLITECAELHSVHTIHTHRNAQCEVLCPETPKRDLYFTLGAALVYFPLQAVAILNYLHLLFRL